MKTVQKEVFWRKPNPEGKGKVRESLGFATANEFETVDEAVSVLTESRLLERLNSQLLTDSMNEFRAAKRPGGTLGKNALRNKANERIDGPTMVSAIQSAAARGVSPAQAIEELVEAEIAKIKAEMGIEDDDES